jgi:transcriptional regulator with XRE-family HTH domain
MLFTPAQCRAARGLLGWSQAQLAGISKVATKTIADFERESRTPYDRTLADIGRVFEAAGVEFTGDGQPGVRTGNAGFLLEEISASSIRVLHVHGGYRYAMAVENRAIVQGTAIIGDAPREPRASARIFAQNAAKRLGFVD